MTFPQRRVLTTVLGRICEPGDEMQSIFTSDEIQRWPPGVLPSLVAARFLKEALPADTVICRECEERCSRPVARFEPDEEKSEVVRSTCHLFAHMGSFEHSRARLNQWSCSREQIAKFVSQAIGAKIRDADDRWRCVRFGTHSIGRVRRALWLEFGGTCTLHVGSKSLPLIDLLDWRGGEITFDHEILCQWAAQSEDPQSGGKRSEPSKSVQSDKMFSTQLKYQRVQAALNEQALVPPKRNKERLAKEIVRLKRGEGLSWGRIARVTLMPPKKDRRKKSA